MENGKGTVVVERPSHAKWVPAPPHMTSHWATISGHLDDPPPRQNGGVAQAHGRRSFPERAGTPQGRGGRPGVAVWGGAHQ